MTLYNLNEDDPRKLVFIIQLLSLFFCLIHCPNFTWRASQEILPYVQPSFLNPSIDDNPTSIHCLPMYGFEKQITLPCHSRRLT